MIASRKRKEAETEMPTIPPTLDTGSSLLATDIEMATARVTAITIVEWPREKKRPHVRLLNPRALDHQQGMSGRDTHGLCPLATKARVALSMALLQLQYQRYWFRCALWRFLGRT